MTDDDDVDDMSDDQNVDEMIDDDDVDDMIGEGDGDVLPDISPVWIAPTGHTLAVPHHFKHSLTLNDSH